MALPVSLSGLDTTVAVAGPFKSSAGNYYLFGKDSSSITTVQAYKSTAPDTSWSSIATSAPSSPVQYISAYQNGDTIHLGVICASSSAAVVLCYLTFNMATDSFVISEVATGSLDTRTSTTAAVYACSIVFRGSDSQPIILYNGARTLNMGTSYARIVYARRTGTNTWTTNVAVGSGGTVDEVNPEAVLGASNVIHFTWSPTASSFGQRALSTGNVLQTASSVVSGNAQFGSAFLPQFVSYVRSATTKLVTSAAGNPNTAESSVYFDSGNTPTLNQGSPGSGASVTIPITGPFRTFNDGTDVWGLYVSNLDSDLWVNKSTDDGATWGTRTSIFTGTVSGETSLSRDGNIYQRGNNIVIPYVVNDNGTLKYNEYIVRSVAAPFAQPNISSGVYRISNSWSDDVLRANWGWVEPFGGNANPNMALAWNGIKNKMLKSSRAGATFDNPIVSTFPLVSTASFGAYWGGVLAPNGDVHMVPMGASVGQKISSLGTVSTYSLVYTLATTAFRGGVLAPNGDIHFIPYSASLTGQKVQTANNNFVSTYSTLTGGGYIGGVLAPNGDIHMIPLIASLGQKIQTANGNFVSTYTLVYTTSGGSYAGGVLAPNGDIHMVPYAATVGQIIQTANGNFVSTYSLVYTNSSGYIGGILGPNGDIHMIPFGANVGQKIQTSNGNFVSTYSLVYTTGSAYAGGVLAPNGDIHMVPYAASVGQKIQTANGNFVSTYSLVTTNGSGAYAGGVLNPNGEIQFIPVIPGATNNIGQKLYTTSALPYDIGFCVSAWLNKF